MTSKDHKRIRTTFTVLTIIYIISLLITSYGIKQNNHRIDELNKTEISLQELADAQSDSCNNYRELRDTVNSFHKTLKQFLLQAYKVRLASGTPTDIKAAKVYKQLANSLHLVRQDCAQRR